jgi:hypothetical protein
MRVSPLTSAPIGGLLGLVFMAALLRAIRTISPRLSFLLNNDGIGLGGQRMLPYVALLWLACLACGILLGVGVGARSRLSPTLPEFIKNGF